MGLKWDRSIPSYRIHQFDTDTQSWTSVGPNLDGRPRSSADVLWDGTNLYITVRAKLSHRDGDGPEVGRIYRFSYNGISYTLDGGFPVQINDLRSDSLVLTKDSTGQLWVTWIEGANVMINRSLTDDFTWGTPFVLTDSVGSYGWAPDGQRIVFNSQSILCLKSAH